MPVESYFFMFSSIVSIWSCPGTSSGSCLKETKHWKHLELGNSCSGWNKISDAVVFINQKVSENELRGSCYRTWWKRGRRGALGSRGRLIRPLEGWRFQHAVRELFHPSAAAGCCDFIFNPSPSIIRPLELSSRRLSSRPPAPCPSNLMHTVTAKPHGQHRARRPLSERTESAAHLHASDTLLRHMTSQTRINGFIWTCVRNRVTLHHKHQTWLHYSAYRK